MRLFSSKANAGLALEVTISCSTVQGNPYSLSSSSRFAWVVQMPHMSLLRPLLFARRDCALVGRLNLS